MKNIPFSPPDIGEDEINEFCESNENIFAEDDFEATVKNGLDYFTEITADKLIEDFSADDLFDFIFTATYDFEQDFAFDFEAILLANRLGFKVGEIPVKVINHRASKVHVLSDSLKMLAELRRIKKRIPKKQEKQI